ncbi:MAG: N-acetylmuramoyl-L-alanine amidase [Saprospiraceae bacterium]
MLQKIIDFFKSLFSSFSSSKPKPAPAPPPTTTKYPTSNLPEADETVPQDGSEITTDNAVVVIDEEDPIVETTTPIDTPTVDLPDVNPEPPEEEEPVVPPTVPDPTPTDPPEDNNTPTTGSSTGSTTTETPTDTGGPATHKARYMWCIDNGHGSKTKGKRSPKFSDGRQLLEYEFNRDIVKKMIRLLKQKGVQHFVVVPEVDVDNLLEERVRRANTKQSHLPRMFLSVHSNAAPAPLGKWSNPSISGVETWYYHNNSRGRKVAAIFQKHLVTATGWKNRHIKSRPTRQFYVLRNTKMTAVLTENGFYNNKAECLELLKDEVRNKIAAAHVDAIMEIEKRGV